MFWGADVRLSEGMRYALDLAGKDEQFTALFNLSGVLASDLGLSAMLISFVPFNGMDLRKHVITSKMPSGWIEHHAERAHERRDPGPHRVRTSLRPFEFREGRMEGDPTRYQVYLDAHEFGLGSGFNVPVRFRGAAAGVVSFLGTRNQPLDAGDRLLLESLALLLHGRLQSQSARDGVLLTPREREVLQWASAGKTSQDIADLLKLSEKTVRQYFERAARKLGTATRTHSVVVALQQGLITL